MRRNPQLPFNNIKSPISTDVIAVGDKVAAVIPNINAFSALGDKKKFVLKMNLVEINDLVLIGYAHNGIYFERDDRKGFDLVVPIMGSNHTMVDGVTHEFNAGENAFLSSNERRRSTLNQSGVNLRMDTDRFKATVASMLDIDLVKVILPNIRTPSLRLGNGSFSNLYNGLFRKIDDLDANSSILRHLAVDDSFYRLSVMLLHPELYFLDATHNGVRQYMTKEIANLCEWLRANLKEPISVTLMEQKSGLSIRVLQYSFQKAFGMRPKQWVRKQRLLAARFILERSNEKIKITTISEEYCFASPSEFAHYYILEFGETPSETIKRTHR